MKKTYSAALSKNSLFPIRSGFNEIAHPSRYFSTTSNSGSLHQIALMHYYQSFFLNHLRHQAPTSRQYLFPKAAISALLLLCLTLLLKNSRRHSTIISIAQSVLFLTGTLFTCFNFYKRVFAPNINQVLTIESGVNDKESMPFSINHFARSG